MQTIDIGEVQSPDQLCNLLRQAAQAYRESAADLQSAWQDPQAGKIWDYAAKQLEQVAARIATRWESI